MYENTLVIPQGAAMVVLGNGHEVPWCAPCLKACNMPLSGTDFALEFVTHGEVCERCHTLLVALDATQPLLNVAPLTKDQENILFYRSVRMVRDELYDLGIDSTAFGGSRIQKWSESMYRFVLLQLATEQLYWCYTRSVHLHSPLQNSNPWDYCVRCYGD